MRRRKKTESPTAVTMSTLDADGNAIINSCSHYLPKIPGVSGFTEIDPQLRKEYMSVYKTSADVDPHYLETPWKPPGVMFADGNSEPSAEYENVDNVYAGYHQSNGECRARRFE